MNVLSIGEVLWDQFPDHKVWGGAPANFAFQAAQCGANASIFTAIGNDKLGDEIEKAVLDCGINLHAQKVSYPTGRVDITLDSTGAAEYTFNDNCAWDHIPFNDTLKQLSEQADLISFGSLAQRGAQSQNSIMQALSAAKASAKVLFDINLRQQFYTKEIIESSLKHADFLKLNEIEIGVITEMFNCDMKQLLNLFSLELIIYTCGGEGSQIMTHDQQYDCPASPCKVVDTVGAGDAFTAFFIYNYLNGVAITKAQEIASAAGAYVCERSGATVNMPNELIGK